MAPAKLLLGVLFADEALLAADPPKNTPVEVLMLPLWLMI
jgi:hypothetical protein